MKREDLNEEFTQRLLNQTKLNSLGHHNYLLGMLLDQLEIYLLAKADIDERGFFVISDTDRGGKVKKKNPAIEAMNESMTNFLKLLKEFGLSPSQAREFQGEVFEMVSKDKKDLLKVPE